MLNLMYTKVYLAPSFNNIVTQNVYYLLNQQHKPYLRPIPYTYHSAATHCSPSCRKMYMWNISLKIMHIYKSI